jgi:peptide/nickel transport system substrate-binding protein
MPFRCIAFVVAVVALLPTAAAESELRIGFTQDPLTLDPANHRNRYTETIIRNLYDGLLTRTSAMEVVPELAESWRQIDAVTYELKLRQGVRFHSGDVMTVTDVEFTFDRLMRTGALGGQTSPRKSLLGPLKEVTIIDSETLRFTLEEPWPIFTGMLPFQQIVNKAFVDRTGAADMATRADGTGPFRLVEWRRGDSVIMERFADYYGGAPDIPPVGPAMVDRVIFKIIPESASRVAALLAGDVHIVNELPPHAMRRVEANPSTRVMSVNSTRTLFVALNNTQPPFDDVRVRRAANHAIDKKLIIEKVLYGAGTTVNGVLSPDALGFEPDLPEYEYNPAKAKMLLGDAGYPHGIDVVLDTGGADKELAEVIASMLAESQIRTKVEIWEASVARRNWRDRHKKQRDMWLTSWGNASLDPVGLFVPTLHTDGRGNWAGYSNHEVDELLDGATAESDRERRVELYRRAQRIVNEEAPWVFLWIPRDIYGVSTRLEGWQPSVDGRIYLHDARLR